MAASTRQGVIVKHRLTTQDLTELQSLSNVCSEQEHLLIRLDYNKLMLSALPTNDIFFYYDNGRLVGSLLLDRYHSDIKEVSCLVHPSFRRRGIFRLLLAAAREECLSRGIRRLLFTCETTSPGGQAAMQALGAGREFAEHRMVLTNFQPRFLMDEHLHLREAEAEGADLDQLAFILAADFSDSKEQALQHILRASERPNQRFYLALYHGQGQREAEPVGTLRVEDVPQEIGIYGFFIRPEYRGRGYGRQMLEEVITAIHARTQLQIMLEVDTNNYTALNLYRSLGFTIERTYEYYGLPLLRTQEEPRY